MLITISFIIFRMVSVVLVILESMVIISIKICKRKCIIVERRFTTFLRYFFITELRLSDVYKMTCSR